MKEELTTNISKDFKEGLKAGKQAGIQDERERIIEIINNIENPYPLDIFPKVELSEFQSHTINDFLCSNLRITLDGFSAELMRRARENLIKEILEKLNTLSGVNTLNGVKEKQ